MKPDITRRLDEILEVINPNPLGVRLDAASFNKKEIKYLNKKAKEKGIEIDWYDSSDDE